MTSVRPAALVTAAAPGGHGAATATATPWAAERLLGGAVLRVGSRGAAVLALQRRLAELDFDQRVTGYFGSRTRANVVAAQNLAGLRADGIVGPVTRQAMATLPRFAIRHVVPGDEGTAVAHLQRVLTAAGHPVEEDGVYGGRTRSALTAYQRRHGATPDGICGSRTWRLLLAHE